MLNVLLKNQTAKNQDGSIVLLLMVLSAVATGTVLLQSTQLNASRSIVANVRTIAARDAVVYQVNRYASLGSTFRNSVDPTLPAGTNQSLVNCLFPDVATAECDGTGDQPVTLYYPIGGSLKRISGGGTVGNANSFPALYDTKGNLCSASIKSANAVCPLEVYTTFKATCPLNQATCSVSDSVAVHYTVRYNQNSITAQGSLPLTEREGFVTMVRTLVTRPTIDPAKQPLYDVPGIFSIDDPNVTPIALPVPSPTSSLTPAQQIIADVVDAQKLIDPVKAQNIKDGTYNCLGPAATVETATAVVLAVKDIADPDVAGSVAAHCINDPVIAGKMADAVVGLDNACSNGIAVGVDTVTKPAVAQSISNSVQAMVASGYSAYSWDLEWMLCATDVTDPAKDTILRNAYAGTPNFAAARAAMDAGLTDPVIIGVLIGWSGEWRDVAVNRTIADALIGITDKGVAQAIVQGKITDPAIIAGLVASPPPFVAYTPPPSPTPPPSASPAPTAPSATPAPTSPPTPGPSNGITDCSLTGTCGTSTGF